MTDRATISMADAWRLRIAADQHALSPADLLALDELRESVRDMVRREVVAALRARRASEREASIDG